MKNIFVLVIIALLFNACSKVNVVLLPEKNNKVGKIEVKNNDKTITLDKPYQQVEAIDGKSDILTKKEVLNKFKESIETLPKKPKNYSLYFKWDSSKIVSKSYKTLKTIKKEAKKDSTLYIDVIGYTDRAGEEKYNKKLSLKRANSISRILQKSGVEKEKINVQYYGEANPVVKTRDGVAKKVNRRVEVTIK